MKPAMPLPVLFTLALALLSMTAAPPPARAQTAGAPAANETRLTAESAQARLAEATRELEGIPSDVADDSAQGRRRGALRRRVALLEEFGALQAEAARQAETKAALPQRLADAKAALEALAGEAAPQAPSTVDEQAFSALENRVSEQRSRVTALREAAAQARSRGGEELPKIASQLVERENEAGRRAAALGSELTTAADETERATLELRVDNARLDAEIARAAAKVRSAEATLLVDLEPVLAAETDLAEKQLERLEQQYALQAKVLEGALAEQRARAEVELAQKERAAEQAATPSARFAAEREARIARSQKSRGDAEAALVAVRKDLAEHERRLATEKDELTTLRELISRPGTSGMAEERIRVTLQQIKLRRQLLDRVMHTGLVPGLTEYRTRRFTVDDTLFGLAERFAKERDGLLDEMPESERAAFIASTDEQLSRLRTALREEKASLTDLIALAQQMQSLALQRLDVLGELERFIRARAFWLRDGRPLGPEVLEPLPAELGTLGAWVAGLASTETWTRSVRTGSGFTAMLYLAALLLAVPAALFWIRQRLRAATRRLNDRVVAEGRRPGLMLLVMATGVSSAAVFPAYFVIAARSVAGAGLPATVAPVLVTVLEHVGYFLFLWFLARSFFARRSIAQVQFDMPREAANALYRALRWFLFGYLLWLVPWLVMREPPFEFQALTRIVYTLFLMMSVVGAIALLHSRSAFVQHRLDALGTGFISGHWQFIGRLLSALAVAVLLLDVAGWRYAARSIGTSYAWSLATLLVLPPLYAGLVGTVRSIARRMLAAVPRPESEDASAQGDPAERVQRVVDFLRLVFVIAGVALIAGYWGLDQRALATLDEMNLYAVRGQGDEPEFVTAADAVRALLFLVVTFWSLRVLPGIYEFALFPRLQVDEGVKYATLTISRYTVFVLGIFFALAEIHLDLGRLGWLMAAIGVGLGFGLQEIVSNFVSGVILLVERPVRPGDIVTVGSITGTVQRINIRATTILNFDRQEVMLPNRSLITSEVTNWTRGDTVNRLVIPIGVAYGTDVDLVSDLLLRIAVAQPEVLEDPAPKVFFMSHGESSLDFELRVFVPSPKEIIVLRDRLNKAINKEFEQHGIEIPFPQRDLHIRSSAVPLAAMTGTSASGA